MHKTLLTCLLGPFILMLALASTAQAENAYIYSYERYGADEGAWALLPVIVDLPDHKAINLFETLKKRKRATYGATDYKGAGNSVVIDAEKCAYATIIAAEISETFAAHGQKLPTFECGGKKLDDPLGILPIFSPILPLWQAFSAQQVPKEAHVHVGAELVTYEAFKQSVERWDDDLMRQIVALLDSPNAAVQASVMSAVLAKKSPNAEELVAERLGSQAPQTRFAAFSALRKSLQPKTVARLSKALEQTKADAERFARYALESPDASLRQKGIRILLASSSEDAFGLALDAIQKNRDSSVVTADFASILNEIKPDQARQLTQYLISIKGEQTASDWLESQNYSPNAEAVARTLIEKYKAPHDSKAKIDGIALPALGLMLESPDAEQADDALYMLILQAKTAQTAGLSNAFLRGLLSPHQGLREHAINYLMLASSPAPSRPLSLLLPLSNVEAERPELSFILSRGLTQPRESFKSATTDLERRAAILAYSKTDDPWLLSAAAPTQLKGALAILKARLTPTAPGLLEDIQQMAVSTDTGLRRDAAFALRFLGPQADTLRLLLLKDSDDYVACTAIRSLNDVQHAHLAREIITVVKNKAPMTRIAALGILPSLLNAQSSTAISTFAANEVFDEDLGVKAAAQTSLARIARESTDAMTAENAVASLALTLQDKDPKIRRLTLLALAKSQRPSAKALIASGLKTDPALAQAVELREKTFSSPMTKLP